MESGGSFPERTWDFSLFACTGGSLGRGDPALPLAKRTGARVACPQSSVLPVQPASSVCKKLINTRCGSRTVAGPGASVLRSGQAMPHFVILRQLHNRVILASCPAKITSWKKRSIHSTEDYLGYSGFRKSMPRQTLREPIAVNEFHPFMK